MSVNNLLPGILSQEVKAPPRRKKKTFGERQFDTVKADRGSNRYSTSSKRDRVPLATALAIHINSQKHPEDALISPIEEVPSFTPNVASPTRGEDSGDAKKTPTKTKITPKKSTTPRKKRTPAKRSGSTASEGTIVKETIVGHDAPGHWEGVEWIENDRENALADNGASADGEIINAIVTADDTPEEIMSPPVVEEPIQPHKTARPKSNLPLRPIPKQHSSQDDIPLLTPVPQRVSTPVRLQAERFSFSSASGSIPIVIDSDDDDRENIDPTLYERPDTRRSTIPATTKPYAGLNEDDTPTASSLTLLPSSRSLSQEHGTPQSSLEMPPSTQKRRRPSTPLFEPVSSGTDELINLRSPESGYARVKTKRPSRPRTRTYAEGSRRKYQVDIPKGRPLPKEKEAPKRKRPRKAKQRTVRASIQGRDISQRERSEQSRSRQPSLGEDSGSPFNPFQDDSPEHGNEEEDEDQTGSQFRIPQYDDTPLQELGPEELNQIDGLPPHENQQNIPPGFVADQDGLAFGLGTPSDDRRRASSPSTCRRRRDDMLEGRKPHTLDEIGSSLVSSSGYESDGAGQLPFSNQETDVNIQSYLKKFTVKRNIPNKSKKKIHRVLGYKPLIPLQTRAVRSHHLPSEARPKLNNPVFLEISKREQHLAMFSAPRRSRGGNAPKKVRRPAEDDPVQTIREPRRDVPKYPPPPPIQPLPFVANSKVSYPKPMPKSKEKSKLPFTNVIDLTHEEHAVDDQIEGSREEREMTRPPRSEGEVEGILDMGEVMNLPDNPVGSQEIRDFVKAATQVEVLDTTPQARLDASTSTTVDKPIPQLNGMELMTLLMSVTVPTATRPQISSDDMSAPSLETKVKRPNPRMEARKARVREKHKKELAQSTLYFGVVGGVETRESLFGPELGRDVSNTVGVDYEDADLTISNQQDDVQVPSSSNHILSSPAPLSIPMPPPRQVRSNTLRSTPDIPSQMSRGITPFPSCAQPNQDHLVNQTPLESRARAEPRASDTQARAQPQAQTRPRPLTFTKSRVSLGARPSKSASISTKVNEHFKNPSQVSPTQRNDDGPFKTRKSLVGIGNTRLVKS